MTKRQFQVLYREFLFRLVDREVLAAHAQGDATKLVGRFATILILVSLPFAGMALVIGGGAHAPREAVLTAAWGTEHAVIATTMLAVALFAVLSWDSTFPDRRDVLVLAPLPVRANTIFLAKAASLATALGLTVVTFNAAPGLAMPLVLSPPSDNPLDMIFSLGLYRALIAYWITMLSAGAFIFCCALFIQGIAAQLPRRIFLRVSAFLQVTAFCLVIVVYFLQPSITAPAVLTAAHNRRLLARFPSYWFLGLFQQLNGYPHGRPVDSTLKMLAMRAWAGLALAILGAGLVFLLSYLRTLRKIVEEPDLVPGSRKRNWLPRFGNSVETAVVHFSIRTLFRSRQHRIIFSFYAGIGFAILILFLKTPVAKQLSAASVIDWRHEVSLPLLASSFLMLCFWTLGIRVVFAIPIELRANWIFRITPIRGCRRYLAASRRAMLALALLPVWGASAILFLSLWPTRAAIEHLVVLGLIGILVIELCLYGFQKIPFTCSYLPGKSNLHMTFALCLTLGLDAAFWCAEFERRALSNPVRYAWILGILCVAAACARWRTQAETTLEGVTLQFEEELSPVIAGLGLHRDGILALEPSNGQSPDE